VEKRGGVADNLVALNYQQKGGSFLLAKAGKGHSKERGKRIRQLKGG